MMTRFPPPSSCSASHPVIDSLCTPPPSPCSSLGDPPQAHATAACHQRSDVTGSSTRDTPMTSSPSAEPTLAVNPLPAHRHHIPTSASGSPAMLRAAIHRPRPLRPQALVSPFFNPICPPFQSYLHFPAVAASTAGPLGQSPITHLSQYTERFLQQQQQQASIRNSRTSVTSREPTAGAQPAGREQFMRPWESPHKPTTVASMTSRSHTTSSKPTTTLRTIQPKAGGVMRPEVTLPVLPLNPKMDTGVYNMIHSVVLANKAISDVMQSSAGLSAPKPSSPAKPRVGRNLNVKAVQLMNEWFDGHLRHPYPGRRDVEQLAQVGGKHLCHDR